MQINELGPSLRLPAPWSQPCRIHLNSGPLCEVGDCAAWLQTDSTIWHGGEMHQNKLMEVESLRLRYLMHSLLHVMVLIVSSSFRTWIRSLWLNVFALRCKVSRQCPDQNKVSLLSTVFSLHIIKRLLGMDTDQRPVSRKIVTTNKNTHTRGKLEQNSSFPNKKKLFLCNAASKCYSINYHFKNNIELVGISGAGLDWFVAYMTMQCTLLGIYSWRHMQKLTVTVSPCVMQLLCMAGMLQQSIRYTCYYTNCQHNSLWFVHFMITDESTSDHPFGFNAVYAYNNLQCSTQCIYKSIVTYTTQIITSISLPYCIYLHNII